MLTKKFKSYVSEFTFRMGPIQTTGKLIAVREPQAKAGSKVVMCSPEGKPVKQVYIEEETKQQFLAGELSRAKVNEDKSLTLIDKDALAEATAPDVPKDTMAVTVHLAETVDGQIFPSDNNAYVFEPADKDPVNVQWYALLHHTVKNNPEYAFIGSANVRNSEGLYRLTIWRDRLVLQRMLYPEDVNDHEPLAVEPLDNTITSKFSKQLLKMVAPFDAAEYRDTTKERVAAVLSGEVVTIKAEKKPTGFDIMDALEAFDE